MGTNAATDHNINKEFLEKVLGDECKILSYNVTHGTKPGDNYMSVIYGIDVQIEGKDGSQLTKHLLIKCYPSHPARQELTSKSNMFYKELEIYRTWIPELRRFQTDEVGLDEPLKLPYALFVHGQCIDFESDEANQHAGKFLDPLENYIVMEDLRKTYGFRMTNRRESLDLDHMKLIFSELAKIHAVSWAYKNHVDKNILKTFPCLVPHYGHDMDLWEELIQVTFVETLEILNRKLGVDNELSKACIRYKDTILRPILEAFYSDDEVNDSPLQAMLRSQPTEEFGKDSPNPEPWRIICHGDCWSNNILFRYDEKTEKPLEAVLVDLQMVRETCVIADLVYILYACTTAELRKNHLYELLQLYHDKFNQVCKIMKTETLPGFNMDSFRYRFHRGKLLGFAMAIGILPLMLKEEEKAVNMEKIDHNVDITEIFSDVVQSSSGSSNAILDQRITELVQEMYDQGVI